jgi:hypothetical protein
MEHSLEKIQKKQNSPNRRFHNWNRIIHGNF